MFHRFVVPCRLAALPLAMALTAQAQAVSSQDIAVDNQLQTIEVTATADEGASESTQAYTIKNSSSGNRLNVAIKETPQTINVVTRQQLDDYQITNLRDVLRNTPGITVSSQETERTTYMSRGFEISNVLMDGIGFPLTSYNYQESNPDTFLYDRIEVVKGAAALSTAFGDPSATINMIRKRPTKELQASAGISYGSWDTTRYEGDVSGSLSSDDRVRGRIMAYEQTGDSYLDHYSLEKNGVAAIVDADLTDSTVLTLGYSETNNKSNGNNWGANPLLNSAGKQISYSQSYNYSPDWTYWDNETRDAFVELKQKLWGDWQATLSYDEKHTSTQSDLLYLVGNPSAMDNTSGLFLYPGRYVNDDDVQRQIDARIAGTFALLGHNHEAVMGYSWSTSEIGQLEYTGTFGNSTTTDQASWTPAAPLWSATSSSGSDYSQKNQSLYAATRLHLNDALKLTLGANYVEASSKGVSYSAPMVYDEHKLAPYAGFTYNFTPEYTGYASYTSIFRPQTTVDATTKNVAAPIEGDSYEVGVKSAWLDDRLTGTLAVFRTTQSNYPLKDADSNPLLHESPISDLQSQGVEVGLVGELTDNLNLSLGYSQYSLKDLKNGGAARRYNPEQTFNMLATYRVPVLPQLKLGAGVQWQGDISQYSSSLNSTIRQDDYALLNLMASYDINNHVSVQANGYNVGNKKYLFSFPYSQGYYGAPANYSIALKFKY